eukprot:SM000119S25638  [mRNA]  locus=s119:167818:171611:+ [translate_table: standard]
MEICHYGEKAGDESAWYEVKRSMFPKDFLFGSATSAYQVEGAVQEGGRGQSIWDVFSHMPGRTHNDDTGDVAVDQYHRYEEDIQLLVDMGMTAYRFSISWPRIFPTGRGPASIHGLAYYNRLIDTLVANGLTPFATLYHWDLPQRLHEQFGGWLSDEIVPVFQAYAEVCFDTFGDRVKHWITVNEPLCHAVVSYGYGVHAPGRCSDENKCKSGDSAREPYIVAHNILKAHAAAVYTYRAVYQKQQNGTIGISLDSDWSEPVNHEPINLAAAERRRIFQLGWFLDPIFLGDYPEVMRKQVGWRLPAFTSEEATSIRGSVDFIGINHYTSRWVSEGSRPTDPAVTDFHRDIWVKAETEKDGVPIGKRAASEWLYIVPWGLGKLLHWITQRYGKTPIYITENGMDEENDENLSLQECRQDPMRVEFHRNYLRSVADAIMWGADVRGYFAWSLLDNFEWASGYSKRFGLHYVDYNNSLERHPKQSAAWFAKVLGGRGSDKMPDFR